MYASLNPGAMCSINQYRQYIVHAAQGGCQGRQEEEGGRKGERPCLVWEAALFLLLPRSASNSAHIQHGARTSFMLDFPAFFLPTNLRQPMHSPTAMMELLSPNLAGTFLLQAVLTA